MAFVKQLSNIDETMKRLVQGWIREIERKLKLSAIPKMIQYICIIYARRHKDEWKCINDEFEAINPNSMNLLGGKTKISCWNNNKISLLCDYGRIQMDTNDEEPYYQINLKIYFTKKIFIGLTQETDNSSSHYTLKAPTYFINLNKKNGGKTIYYEGDGGPPIYKEYCAGLTYPSGDIDVVLFLDLRYKHIKCKINGSDQGMAFRNIKDGNYKLMLTLCDFGDDAEIIHIKNK